MFLLEKLGFYNIKKTISDLSVESYVSQSNISDLRNKINILIIDDKEFNLLDALKSCGYNLRCLNDISDLRDVSAYEIILCDIMGVGIKIDSELQGASVIKQIKLKYPSKRVIAYTASNYNPTFNDALSYADSVMLKEASFDDWSSLLNEQIQKLMNPIVQWEILRKTLLQAGVSTIEVAKIENNYVSSFQKKNSHQIENIVKIGPPNVSKILSDFLSTTLAKIVLGAM